MLKNIDLQLFAEDDDPEIDPEIDPEVDPEADPEAEPEADPEVDPETEPETDPEDPSKKVKKPVDKVTAAVIKQKQENKKLRDELAQLRKEKAERDQAEKDKKYRQKLLDDGLSEEDADEKVADKREREQLKRDLRELKYQGQAEKLAVKYPDIYEHLDRFIKIVESSDGEMTLAELCKAKLSEQSEYETRTKTEQELLLTKKKAGEKQIKTGEIHEDKPVKLSTSDERILADMNRKRQLAGKPPMTRKDYYELSTM